MHGFLKLLQSNHLVAKEPSCFAPPLQIISQVTRGDNFDAGRFERISSIIKQFKLRAARMGVGLEGFEIENSKFKALVDSFTPTTYIMVITTEDYVSKSTYYHSVSRHKQTT